MHRFRKEEKTASSRRWRAVRNDIVTQRKNDKRRIGSGELLLKRSPQFVGLLGILAVMVPCALAQESHISRENGVWSQASSGSMSAAKNVRVRVDMGSVVVRGSQQTGIDYALHMRSSGSSEEEAKRQFEGYKVTTYIHGDTAWVVGEWQGTHSIHVGSARVSISTSSHKFSGEFVVNLPRNTESLRVETGGGGDGRDRRRSH
jgi:hypothetical protein